MVIIIIIIIIVYLYIIFFNVLIFAMQLPRLVLDEREGGRAQLFDRLVSH